MDRPVLYFLPPDFRCRAGLLLVTHEDDNLSHTIPNFPQDSFERSDRSSSSESSSEEEAENAAFHEAKKIRRKRKNPTKRQPKRKVY